jgi:endo-1,4-beta-xylanase
MQRRRFLRYAGAALAGAAIGVVAGRHAEMTGPSQIITETATQSRTVTETTIEKFTESTCCSATLRAAAETRGILVGAATNSRFIEEAPYRNTLVREFNFITTENEMKWWKVHPDPDRWNFTPADTLVKFASDHQMKVKGHTLIWKDERTPEWVKEERSTEEFRQMLQEHIETLVGRYRGRVYAWDVVNEAVDPDQSNGLRKTVFLEKLGEGYIAEAFRFAHEADPDALLLYNDYGAESINSDPYLKARSDRVYRLVKELLAEGVPIHGVGFQMHLNAWNYPKPADVAANVRRLAELGLKVNISEMDVRITEKELGGTLTQRLEMQHRIYHNIIAACVKEQGFMAVTFWGFTDAHSWIDEEFGPDDPLVFDEDYKPKPAYWGVMDALLGG